MHFSNDWDDKMETWLDLCYTEGKAASKSGTAEHPKKFSQLEDS